MPIDISGLTQGIEEVARSKPQIFGQQTTQPLTRSEYLEQQFRSRFGTNGPTNLQRAQAGGTWSANDDLQGLEVFGLNEQRDALTGRNQERVLSGLANRIGASERAAEARDRGARRAAVDEGIFERQTRGRGVSARQARSAQRRLGLNRALAVADAGSGSRRDSTELAIGARKAGVDLENAVFGQELAGLTSLANAEGQHQQRVAAERAAKKNEKRALIGNAIGIGASLLAMSSEATKDKRGKADGLLSKLKALRVDRWNYKGEGREHIGPYAEEFNDTFNTGEGHRGMISMVDAVGVALGAIKELDAKVSAHGS